MPTSYTQSADALWRLQVDPTRDAAGNLTSCSVQAFYSAKLTNDVDSADVVVKQHGSVTVDAIAKAAKTVTFDFAGQSYTLPYGLIVTAVGRAADQEWAESLVPLAE